MQIGQRLSKLDKARQGIRDQRDKIEDETRQAFAGMIGRLDDSAGPKIARLTAQMAELDSMVEEIDLVLQDSEMSIRSGPAYLMTRIKVFKDNINYLMLKTFDKEVNETPYDLPRELYELRNSLESMADEELLMEFKNTIIKDLALNIITQKKNQIQEISSHSQQEVKSWIDLSEKLGKKLNEFALICHFCAEPFSHSVVNSKCLLNKFSNFNTLANFKGFSVEKPDYDELGTGYHFFAKPDPEAFKDTRLLQLLTMQKQAKSTNPFRQAMIHDTEQYLNGIRRAIEDHPTVRLEEVLESHDKHGVGVINRITLVYVLNNLYGLTEREVDPVVAVMDPFKHDLINIKEFVSILEDPLSIDNLPFFTYAQQPTLQGYNQYLNKFEDFRKKEEERLRNEEKAKEKIVLETEKHYQLLIKEKREREKKEKEKLQPKSM